MAPAAAAAAAATIPVLHITCARRSAYAGTKSSSTGTDHGITKNGSASGCTTARLGLRTPSSTISGPAAVRARPAHAADGATIAASATAAAAAIADAVADAAAHTAGAALVRTRRGKATTVDGSCDGAGGIASTGDGRVVWLPLLLLPGVRCRWLVKHCAECGTVVAVLWSEVSVVAW